MTGTPPDSFDTIDATFVGVRFLLPFTFARRKRRRRDMKDAQPGIPFRTLEALRRLELRGRRVWMPVHQKDVHALYLDEAIDPVKRAVFPESDERYWRVDDDVLGAILPRDTTVRFRDGATLGIEALRPFGIELFLSHFGFGVLSMGLQADPRAIRGERHRSPATAASLLVYELSQVRDSKRAELFRPHPMDDEERRKAIERSGASIPPAPEAGAPLEQRLGIPGGRFALPELARFLLPFKARPFQVTRKRTPGTAGPRLAPFEAGQFNVYAAVRIGHLQGQSFAGHPQREALGSLLLGLAQLQEPQHAGNDLEHAHVEHQLLNRFHWTASSSLGAAHLVLDQAGTPDWNLQGPQHYLAKYFVPALLAHHQRRHAEMVVREARQAAEGLLASKTRHPGKLNALTRDMFSFELSAAFPTVSTRHVVNVFYEHCRRGERAATALDQARDAITRLDDALRRVQQEKNLSIVALVQQNVEWIEIFLIAVYALEVAAHVSEAFHFKAYGEWSLVVLPILCALTAFWRLRPDLLEEHAESGHGGSGRQFSLLALIGALFVTWFLLGLAVVSIH